MGLGPNSPLWAIVLLHLAISGHGRTIGSQLPKSNKHDEAGSIDQQGKRALQQAGSSSSAVPGTQNDDVCLSSQARAVNALLTR